MKKDHQCQGDNTPSSYTKCKKSKRKGGTLSNKLYRYESFSKRVSKISINPVRRTYTSTLDYTGQSSKSSLFGQALLEWADINISHNFVDFVRATRSTCETLPQVIHHADFIMDSLETHIKEKDALSLEPLLNLLTYLARDLGPSFECYFGRAVVIICDIASVHEEINVVECCFNSLAWLFKYLSRLLVPDLRPLYNLMAPLIGKAQQKYFVMRFATEAFSFLIRKASFTYHKNQGPLNMILSHILADVATTSGLERNRYSDSVTNLIFESMRGVKRGIHVTGITTFTVFLQRLIASSSESYSATQSNFLLSELLYRLAQNLDDMEPIMETILQTISKLSSENSAHELALAAFLLKTAIATRKGHLIQNWATVFTILEKLLKCERANSMDNEAMDNFQDTVMVIFCHSPIEQAKSRSGLLHDLTSGPWRMRFLRLCWKSSETDGQRFEQLLLPVLQSFVDKQPFEYAADTGCLVSHLFELGYIARDALRCPKNWQYEICNSFNRLANDEEEDECLISLQCFVYVQILNIMDVHPDTCLAVAHNLKRLIYSASALIESEMVNIRAQLAFTGALKFLSQADCCCDSMWSLICASSKSFKSIPSFWQAVLCFLESQNFILNLEDEACGLIIDSLIQSLSNSSHELRSLCLSTISVLYQKTNQEVPKLLECLIRVEETLPTMENMRTLSMEIRKVGSLYKNATIDPWLRLVVPSFCFGLLHVKLSQLWDDARFVIMNIIDIKTSDDFLLNKFVSWLQIKDPTEKDTDNVNVESYGNKIGFTERKTDLQDFFDTHIKEHPEFTTSCRSQALRLLDGVPWFAENKSRQIVPIFLEAQNRHFDKDCCDEATEEDCSHTQYGHQNWRWNRKDRKLFLDVFSKFRNPRVIFKSQEVYETLIQLLGIGDLEYQQAAFKAIQAWRISSVNRYLNQLNSLLDEAKYNDEIVNFLGSELREGDLDDSERAELTPILMHILYGRATAKRASTFGSRDLCARRRNIVVSISNLGQKELEAFLDIALCQGKIGIAIDTSGKVSKDLINPNLRNMHGTLKMIEDMLVALGSRLAVLAPRMISAVLSCIECFSKHAKGHELRGDIKELKQNSLHKLIRRDAINCIILFSEKCPGLITDVYLPVIVNKLVEPRLECLPIENVHSISSVLKLLRSLFAISEQACYLLDKNPTILRKVVDCLKIPSAKPEVITYILGEIMVPTLELTSSNQLQQESTEAPVKMQPTLSDYLRKEANYIIINLSRYLEKCSDKDLTQLGFRALSLTARLVYVLEDIVAIIGICTYLLLRGPKKITVGTVEDILQLLHHLFTEHQERIAMIDYDRLLEAFCVHFTVQRNDTTRALLCSTLEVFTFNEFFLKKINNFDFAVKLSLQLNAALPQTLNPLNENQQINALSTIVQLTSSDYRALFWKLPFSNILYHLRYSDDFVIRNHCSAALRRLINFAGDEGELGITAKCYVKEAIIPYFYRGMLDKSEAKRTDFLNLCAYLIKMCPRIHIITELQVLNFYNEEEASFFNNILHVQLHRRIRALKRLSQEIHAGKISTRNIKDFLLPLIQHFTLDPKENDNGQNLALEAVAATENLLQWLKWQECLIVFDSYLGYLRSAAYNTNLIIKLIGAAANALWKASMANSCKVSYETRKPKDGLSSSDESEMLPVTQLASTVPSTEELIQDLTIRRIPTMMKYLREKEVNEIGSRASIAISAIKLIMTLPEQETVNLLPSVLSDLTRILKSREQDSRDLARKALTETVHVLGPSYFSSILKELQSALQKGYQLHILGFTLHSLLLAAVDCFSVGTLDYCIAQIMQSIYDDIFGETGKDKDREGYTSKMKEVKVKKSFDSIELMIKLIEPQNLMEILEPIRKLLCGKIDTSSFTKVEEVLRRLCLGIAYNKSYHNQNTLVLCYELFVNSPSSTTRLITQSNHSVSKGGAIVSNPKKYPLQDLTPIYVQKMRRFALDAARLIIQKSFEVRKPTSISGLLPIINEAIVDEREEVKISGLRLLVAIIKVPSSKLDSDAATYVSEAVRIIEESSATNTEVAQASIKLVAAILRERKSVPLRDQDIIYILKKIQPDLREPDRQGVTFNFLKAVLIRKVLAPEVYDVIDEIAKVMVTNHSANTREQARALYLQFLIEYPQSQARLEKQIAFLLKNLEYEHTDGRVSVMEALHIILKKFGDKVLQPLLEACFIPLLLVVCNDKASECRELAGELIKMIFGKANNSLTENFLLLLNNWLEQTGQPALQRMSIRCWSMFIEAGQYLAPLQLNRLRSKLLDVLASDSNTGSDETEWEMIYLSLELFLKLSTSEARKGMQLLQDNIWSIIVSKLNFPHTWVKLTASRLVGILLTRTEDCDTKCSQSAQQNLGQKEPRLMISDMVYIMLCSFDVLDSLLLNEELAVQTAQNLFHLGCQFASDNLKVEDKSLLANNSALPSHTMNSTGALAYLFVKAAGILPRHPSMIRSDNWRSQAAVLQLLSSLIQSLTSEAIVPSVKVILAPLHSLVVSDSKASTNCEQSVREAHKSILEKSNDIMDKLRDNFNVEFLKALQEIRRETFEKRKERRAKRKLEAVNMPEKDLAKKRKKHELARRNRKEKSSQARGKRRGW